MRLYSTLPRLFAIAPPKAGAALLPRTEMARRPPKAENRAHIPRAIASREAMLWQGCSLSPRELERKAPRSVWATQLPASRPIRWIVRESREANRTDFATHPARPRTDAPAFHLTDFATHPARQSDGLTFGIPSPAFPRTDSPAFGRPTLIQPFPNPDMDGINRHSTTTQPSFVSNPRTIPTQPSHIRDSPTPTQPQPQPQQNVGRISPDDRREEPRDSPATKSSGCLSAKREPRRGRKGPSGRYAGCKYAPL